MKSVSEIRPFRWEDAPSLTSIFNEANGLSGTEKEFDTGYLRELLSLPSCDPERNCFVVEDGPEVVGYLLVSPEHSIRRAVVSWGMLREREGEELTLLLMRRAIEHAAELGMDVVHVEVPPHHQTLHRLLRAEGFDIIRRYWQMRWNEGRPPTLEMSREFALRSFVIGQDEGALTWLQNLSFGENWGFSPNTVEEIAARVRLSRCDPEGIIFITHAGHPIAYNWTLMSANDERATGTISMTGVHPEYRGRGLGRAIVVAGMRFLHERGTDSIELEVDYENPAARDLYTKLGFRRFGETIWFEKSLKPAAPASL
jgi:mycothiol synthase